MHVVQGLEFLGELDGAIKFEAQEFAPMALLNGFCVLSLNFV